MTDSRRLLSHLLIRKELTPSARAVFQVPMSWSSPGLTRQLLDRSQILIPVNPSAKKLGNFVSLEALPEGVRPPAKPPVTPQLGSPSTPTQQQGGAQGQWLKTGTGSSVFVNSLHSTPAPQTQKKAEVAAAPETAVRTLPTPLPATHASWMGMLSRIKADFETQLPKVLSLNRSRREQILQYLELAAGASGTRRGEGDEKTLLQEWIQDPVTPQRRQALQALVEEISLVALGQMIVLKAWSDRGIRVLTVKDLTQLNAVLGQALQSHAPLDRDHWQLARQGIYSWYSPLVATSTELFETLSSISLAQESPLMLIPVFAQLRHVRTDSAHWKIWDSRFYQTLWNQVGRWGFSQRRTKTVFCPTLRDGKIARVAPAGIQWAALEANAFQLFLAELMQLWEGPSAPPLWTQGNGLEVHPREQLTLTLGGGRPTAQSRLAEMDACDLAFVFEDRPIKVGSKSPEGARLRAQLDQLPFFKKMREAATTLGDLQAAVALSKLRPGAHLVWIREERLGSQDGSELLNFLLDRGCLLAEWDFTQLKVQVASTEAIIPQFVYVFKREVDHTIRGQHLPKRISIHGTVSSYLEIEPLLADSFCALEELRPERRAGFRIHVEASSTPQKEWAAHWPSQVDHTGLEDIERMRKEGSPLATLCTVRSASTAPSIPSGARNRGMIWVRAEKDSEGRKLHVEVVSQRDGSPQPSGSHAFWIIAPSEEFTCALAQWLKAPAVAQWIEHHSERKGDKWVLSESVLKYIPIPAALISVLQPRDESLFSRMPQDWKLALSRIDQQPRDLLALVDRLSHSSAPQFAQELRALAFVHAASSLERVQSARARMGRMVSEHGQIRWHELFSLLPVTEMMPATLHPTVQVSGNIPSQVPIIRIQRMKSGLTLHFVTEAGFHMQLTVGQARVLEMIEEQLKRLDHPTWAEVVQCLQLPRRLELAEVNANDILLSYGEQQGKIETLSAILARCRP